MILTLSAIPEIEFGQTIFLLYSIKSSFLSDIAFSPTEFCFPKTIFAQKHLTSAAKD